MVYCVVTEVAATAGIDSIQEKHEKVGVFHFDGVSRTEVAESVYTL